MTHRIRNTQFRHEYTRSAHVIDQVDVWVDGSNDLVDWIYNFRTMRSIGDNERVNRMDRHEAIRVLRVLLRTYPNTQKWYINGHSRGGAIAQIVARELARKGHRVLLRCVGSKRTGNRRFVQALSGVVRTLSVRNRGDLVPFLPPWYARLQPEIVTYKPWSGPYKAHVDYDGWR